MVARALAKRLARRLGFDVIRSRPGAPPRSLADALEHLYRMGIRPAGVCDIGVGRATPELYRLFPDARYLLVDPLEECRPVMDRVLESVVGSAYVGAVASRAGEVTLSVAPHDIEASSVVGGNALQRLWEQRVVESSTLDHLVGVRGLPGPFLLKIDVQGAELEVLEGARETLRSTVAVALEVSLIQGYEHGPELAEVTAFMSSRGFVAYDIVAAVNRPLDGALMFVDMIFVPRDSPLRASRAYSEDL